MTDWWVEPLEDFLVHISLRIGRQLRCRTDKYIKIFDIQDPLLHLCMTVAHSNMLHMLCYRTGTLCSDETKRRTTLPSLCPPLSTPTSGSIKVERIKRFSPPLLFLCLHSDCGGTFKPVSTLYIYTDGCIHMCKSCHCWICAWGLWQVHKVYCESKQKKNIKSTVVHSWIGKPSKNR